MKQDETAGENRADERRIQAEKDVVRADVRRKKAELLPQMDEAACAKAAARHLAASALYGECRCLFLFVSKRGEISTEFLMERALADQKLVAVPRTNGEKLDFYYISANQSLERQLESGAFGIREPLQTLAKAEPSAVAGKSLVVLPGLAFAKNGARLGYGRGFYDRFLASAFGGGASQSRPLALVGMGYGFQLYEKLPCGAHDVPLTHFLCENGLCACWKNGA